MLLTVFVLSIPGFNLLSVAKALKVAFFIHPGYVVGQVCEQ